MRAATSCVPSLADFHLLDRHLTRALLPLQAAILAQKLTRPAYAGLTPLTQLLLFNAVLDGTASVSNPAYPSWQDNQHCPCAAHLIVLIGAHD